MILELLAVAALLGHGVQGDLPAGCVPLNEQTISNVDPATIFGANGDLADVIPPVRSGSWSSQYATPTQHFAINQAKNGFSAIRQGAYSVWLDYDGATYDAYTMDRWTDPERSDEMQQQTPAAMNEPWNKLTSLGTNMKQTVSGPDGNKKATFSGRSGVRVGILGSDDPTWTDFGDMYADFLYTDVNGGTMEVPIVRGSAMMTNRFTSANPVVAPFCLSSVNGIAATYSCPSERDISDPGEGYSTATCTGGILTLYLKSTKDLDVSQVEYAYNTAAGWPASHPMNLCGPECVQTDSRTVEVTLTGASGEMYYAFNVIGKYVIPPDWENSPSSTTCSGVVYIDGQDTVLEAPEPVYGQACDDDICHTPSCDIQGAINNFGLVVDLLAEPIDNEEGIQIAATESSDWGPSVPMLTCSDPTITCSVSPDGTTVTYNSTFDSQDTTVNYAINVIGQFVKPEGDWLASPYSYTCGDPVDPPATSTSSPTTTDPGNPPGSTVAPSYCSDVPTLSECPSTFCKQAYCAAASTSDSYFKLVVQMSEPVSGIDQVQIAASAAADWTATMITCTPDVCTLEPDMKTLIYCNTFAAGPVYYAVNVMGRFIQPPSDWTTDPYQTQCGGSGTVIATGSKFVLELDEPNDNLPDQTRKFVIYFPQDMTAILDANGLNFEPLAGGQYTGIMQLAYAGSNTRGDLTPADFFDQYQGVFSSRPVTSYCAMDGIGYLDYNWNKSDADGPTTAGELLMIAQPHHEDIISGGLVPIDTPFTFKGYVADFWLMEYDLPAATLDPNPDGVQLVKDNPEWNANVLNGLDVDNTTQDLDNSCVTMNSYYLGKDIALVARLASLSRAFGTTHYEDLDPQLLACIEKWLRIDDTLDEANKFWYDTVYGGMLLRGGPDDTPIDPTSNFGFPVYSDHHFHLGYLIYAMAYYAQHYPTWAQANLERILSIVRDVSNPGRADAYFPVVRHKDFYIGHSWATGLLAGERQQESSSEAINCYHAVAALGQALGDTNLQEIGQLMLAMEIHSVREYYHVRDNTRYHFPQHILDYGTIGMYAEDNIFLYTLNWACNPQEFPMRHACLVGIQIIPIVSVTNLYVDQEWSASVFDSCSYALDPLSAPGSELADPAIMVPVSTAWGTFCHSVLSKYNSTTQAAAADYVKDLSTSDLEGGTGVASTLLYIYAST